MPDTKGTRSLHISEHEDWNEARTELLVTQTVILIHHGNLTYIDFAHKKRQFYVSLETAPSSTPPWKRQNIYRYFCKDTAFSRFWYLNCAIPLPLAAIKIISKHKVVYALNLVSDPRLLYKRYNFCDKQKELTDEFKAKIILYPFPRCFQRVQSFLTKMSNFPTTCHKETSQPPTPPSPNVQLTFLQFLWAKSLCKASLR